MSTGDRPGLRERKNARTRDAIERAAAELALEQGYDHTTVNQIAERADVAPRTVYVRYQTKEAILFSEAEAQQGIRAWLDGGDGDLVDRLGALAEGMVAAVPKQDVELKRLKMRAIWGDPYLRRVLRGKLDDAEELIAVHIAGELGVPPDDSGPRVFAAAMAGMFLTMGLRACEEPEGFDPAKECAAGIAFLRAGLDALKANAKKG